MRQRNDLLARQRNKMRLNGWKKFARLSWRERALLSEALVSLTAARLALFWIPIKQLAPRLGKLHAQSSAACPSPAAHAHAQRVCWAVQTMSRRVLWRSVCFDQAVAAKWMLRRRAIPSTLYLGVARDARQGFIAHAWLRCGEVYVTGGRQRSHFTVVATFAETPQDS